MRLFSVGCSCSASSKKQTRFFAQSRLELLFDLPTQNYVGDDKEVQQERWNETPTVTITFYFHDISWCERKKRLLRCLWLQSSMRWDLRRDLYTAKSSCCANCASRKPTKDLVDTSSIVSNRPSIYPHFSRFRDFYAMHLRCLIKWVRAFQIIIIV